MENMSVRIKYILVCVCVAVALLIIVILAINHKTLKCTFDKELIEGMNQSESLKISINFNMVKKIDLEKKIKISEFYDTKHTYYDSLEKLLRNAYSYLGDDYSIKKEEKSIITNINTKREGIVLDNITIKQNGVENTTLRYDAETKLEGEKAIKINEKISKKDLKSKIEKIGYRCK